MKTFLYYFSFLLVIGVQSAAYKALEEFYLKSPQDSRFIEFSNISSFTHPSRSAILPAPRVMSRENYNILKAGTMQRARAFWALYEDMLSLQMNAEKEGVLPDRFILDLMWEHPLRHSLLKELSLEDFLIYAPDIILHDDGHFYVIEDNFDFPGGFSDSYDIKKQLLEFFPDLLSEYNLSLKYNLSKLFAEKFTRGSQKHAILFVHPVFLDKEKTFFSYLKKEGIEVHSLEGYEQNRFSFLFNDREKTLEFCSHRCREVDNIHFYGIKDMSLSEFSSDLYIAQQSRVVKVSGLGYTSFFSNKALTPYMSHLIRFYLKEEPILKDIETLNLEKPEHQSVLRNKFENWVVKKADGQQGSEVWIGRDESLSRVIKKRLLQALKASPKNFVVQKYMQPEVFLGGYVDYRPFLFINSKGVSMANHLWGRWASTSGHGKTNLSQGALRTPIFVDGLELKTRSCEQSLLSD